MEDGKKRFFSFEKNGGEGVRASSILVLADQAGNKNRFERRPKPPRRDRARDADAAADDVTDDIACSDGIIRCVTVSRGVRRVFIGDHLRRRPDVGPQVVRFRRIRLTGRHRVRVCSVRPVGVVHGRSGPLSI